MKLGANTWIWVSPLTDERLTQLAPRVRDMGFDVVELPVEQQADRVREGIDGFQRLLDGVWMDAGATAVAAIEAFEDAGQDVPPITGEDQNDFLTKWKEDGLKAVAPTYSNFQWRTAVIAAVKVLKGEEVANPWVLPQPKITQENLDQYVKPDMPPLYYALCGCEDLPGFPEKWGGK